MALGVAASRCLLVAVIIVGVAMMLRPLPPGSWTEDWFDGADKLFHLAFFALLWFLGLKARLASGKALAVGLLLLGAGIELAQAGFTTTRSASWADMLADAAGLLLGAALARWALRGQPEEHGG
jgi:VanZ family protein